ncbi:fluoride efflux transporter FluC [Nocardioides bruguierae]|uniref:Fluoride-specific ion channel FluC n=1 Tax=Nocardioides bruguierae TaxID=2945102 RepID=A0A9X2IGL2_9ACTN|nr:CrcB family protein [Nocardioides bruguierae]MCL8023869.1 CrcB family protein [Nocardioides bruguierae]MCM0621684.1 CrcB family protein [Nocardioides bruguierae]
MSAPRPSAMLAVAVGGALGAVLRWWLGEVAPDGAGFPGTTFAINVGGAFGLGLLPAVAAVRRRPLLTAGIGTGVLGGFTTLSTASEQARVLLASGQVLLGLVYVVGTLLAAVAAVAVADRLSTRAQQARVEAEGGDE